MKHTNVRLISLMIMSIGSVACAGIWTVTNTNDSGAGSLRQAILNVNSDPIAPYVINFAIDSGMQTIEPLSPLPAITASYTLVDATSQPGWSEGNPQIVLSAASLDSFTVDGLVLSGVHNCIIRGFVINNGFNNGILITDGGVGAHDNRIMQCFLGVDPTGAAALPNENGVSIIGSTSFTNNCNTIGGNAIEQRNIISGNRSLGVNILTNTNSTFVQNNYIGTSFNGVTAIANEGGGVSIVGSLVLDTTEKSVATVIQSNLISGNAVAGIILGVNAAQSAIENNYVGIDATGMELLPNDIGILAMGVASPDIFDPTNGAITLLTINQNLIAGNVSHGVVLGTNTLDSIVINNAIGTDESGAVALGNGDDGILIQGDTDAPVMNSWIGGSQSSNTIAYNGGYGIEMTGDLSTPSILNVMLSNAIHHNGSDGVLLSNNSNHLQATPTILQALLAPDGMSLIVSVAAPSTPLDSDFIIDFFVNSEDRTPITEGEQYVGSISSIPTGAMMVKFLPLSSPLASGLWMSATATQVTSGDTSQYSSNIVIETLSIAIPDSMFELCHQPVP